MTPAPFDNRASGAVHGDRPSQSANSQGGGWGSTDDLDQVAIGEHRAQCVTWSIALELSSDAKAPIRMKRRPCQVPSDVVTPRTQLAGLVNDRLSGLRLDMASETIRRLNADERSIVSLELGNSGNPAAFFEGRYDQPDSRAPLTRAHWLPLAAAGHFLDHAFATGRGDDAPPVEREHEP